MITILEKISESCLIKVVRVKKEAEQLFEIIKNDLSSDDIKSFDSIKNIKRKREWLSVRILLKELLGDYKEIRYDQLKNPYIDSDYNISITHSQNIVGVILSKSNHIGIDTEFMSDRILRTAHKFIISEELSKFKEDTKLKQIYLNWCGKETLYKLKGGGGIDFKENLKIEINEIDDLGSLKGFVYNEHNTEKYIIYYQFIKTRSDELLITWHS